MNLSSQAFLSVVLPAYNRADAVPSTLAAYRAQTGLSEGFELLAIDDASTDGTGDILAATAASGDLPMRVFTQTQNAGPGAARNRALDAAKGDIVIFVGDDIVPEPDFLARHLAWHRAHPAPEDAMVGRTVWAAGMGPPALLDWLETKGTQFDYGRMKDGGRIEAGQFYTSNASVKRAFLDRCGHRFDPTLRFFEDREFAERLVASGMRLWHDANARAAHLHPTTLDTSLDRMRNAGAAAAMLERAFPNIFQAAFGRAVDPYSLGARIKRALLSPALGAGLWVPLARLVANRDAPPGQRDATLLALAHGCALLGGLRSGRIGIDP